ncbi:hypothetical protein BDR22DRAFT_811539, partial [Usnea florida]
IRPVHSTSYFPTLYFFIKRNPLVILTSAIPFGIHPAIKSSHIPWVVNLGDSPGPSDLHPSH